MKLNYHHAHSLSEYSLILGLAVIIGIGGLTALGSQVSDMLGNTIASQNGNPKRLAIPSQNTQNNVPLASPPASSIFISSNEVESILNQAPTQTLVLADGRKLTLPNPNFNELQETLGPNGSTEVALALIQRMQAALKEAGIDPETVIPELSLFSKTGHQMSDQQKEGESLLLESMFPGDKKVADLFATMTSYTQKMGRQIGFFEQREAKQLTFQKDGNGSFLVSGTVEMNGQTNPNPKPIEDFPVIDRLFYTGELTKQRLQTEPNLQALFPQFSKILETINQNNANLIYENRVRSTPYTGEIKEATWLSTKIESNKACLLSKDKTCLR
jgi:hypothetical protein